MDIEMAGNHPHDVRKVSLGAVGEANPASTKTAADVQCIVVGARLAESPNLRLKLSGEMLLSYFLGRVDGRYPHIDLEALIEKEAKTLTAAGFKSAARRCAAHPNRQGSAAAWDVTVGTIVSDPFAADILYPRDRP